MVCFCFFAFFSFVHREPRGVRSAGLLVRKATRLGTLVGDCSEKQNLLEIETQQIHPVQEPLWCRFRKCRVTMKRKTDYK